jgi:ABC-type transporter Mla MlaB component
MWEHQSVAGRATNEETLDVAALSIVSMRGNGSRAQLIGEIDDGNVGWLGDHLRELEGDVTLDCRRSAFTDPAALMMLVEFEQFLRRRGNRLTIDGVPTGAAPRSTARSA